MRAGVFVATLAMLLGVASAAHAQAGASPAASLETACAADLSTVAAVERCHDLAFFALKTEPVAARAVMAMLCDEHALARACSNLAFAIENDGSRPDLAAARLRYEKACELEDGVACHNLADLYLLGRGVAVDQKEGVRLLQRACELDYASACFREAWIVSAGKLLPKDPPRMAALLRRGCDLKDAASCHDLGYALMDGNGVPRDQAAATAVITRSCDMGLPRGCATLGFLYMNGGAGAVDYGRARDLMQRACAGGDAPTCSNLGYMIETGKGGPADPARAAVFYAQACRAGDALGCGNLGELQADGRGLPRDDQRALPNLARGCADSVSEACRYLASFHEQGRGGLPVSKPTARFYRRKACEAGDEPSCGVLARGFRSLCEPGETSAMACMTGRQRMVSLCSAPRPDGPATLVYRFGTPARTELRYDGPMSLSTDAWTLGSQTTLTFQVGATRYDIVEKIDTAQDPVQRHAHLDVTTGADRDGSARRVPKTTHIDCVPPWLGRLDSEAVRKAGNLAAAPR